MLMLDELEFLCDRTNDVMTEEGLQALAAQVISLTTPYPYRNRAVEAEGV